MVVFWGSFVMATPENAEKELKTLEAEIKKLELACTPSPGTSKEDVEKIFGKGKIAVNSKIKPQKIPEDSPFRSYVLYKNGVLWVRYSENNKVESAHYLNPYSTKGRPIGYKEPLIQRLSSARERLAQMKIILQEYLKKRDKSIK
jgi:hypothetical protein